MNLLHVENLKKSFGNNEVLKGIGFDLQQGKVLAIIGPSGSGKSTLLRCLTLLETPDSGEIRYIDDYLLKTENEKVIHADRRMTSKIRGYFGLVFQSFNLFPHFSVMKNITEAQVLVLQKTKEEAESTARKLLEKMNLSDKANSYPCELSGGQQQRVSIARAMALNPKILFFDEPTSALDPELTGEILKVIKDLANEKMTMVIVTHEMNFAASVADEIIFMDDGKIVEHGEARQMIENPFSERLKEFLSKIKN